MSLGFRTESALIPKKSKEILVDKESLIGLEAAINEYKVKNKDKPVISNIRKKTSKRIIVGKKEEEDKLGNSNKGIEERIKYDEESRLNLNKSKMVEQALERKAMLYNKMVNGEIEADEDCLVNFDEKVKRKSFEETAPPKKKYKHRRVLIEDRHGRLRWVKEGSSDHMDRIGIAHRLVQLNPWLKNVVDFEDVDLDRIITTDQADKMKKEREEEEEGQKKRNGIKLFKSQWEFVKSKDEKEYLENLSHKTKEIRNEVINKTSKIFEQIDSITSNNNKVEEKDNKVEEEDDEKKKRKEKDEIAKKKLKGLFDLIKNKESDKNPIQNEESNVQSEQSQLTPPPPPPPPPPQQQQQQQQQQPQLPLYNNNQYFPPPQYQYYYQNQSSYYNQYPGYYTYPSQYQFTQSYPIPQDNANLNQQQNPIPNADPYSKPNVAYLPSHQ